MIATAPEIRTIQLRLGQIRTDGGTQMWPWIEESDLVALSEVLEEEGELDAVECVHDGADYWLFNGFRRLEVYRRAGRKTIFAKVRPGTVRDAILLSTGANCDNRVCRRRTPEVIRRSIETLLRDPEWGQWSDVKICEKVGLNTGGWGRQQVAEVRRALSCPAGKMDRSAPAGPQTRTVERNGASYQMTLGRSDRATPRMTPAPAAVRRTEREGIWQRILIPPGRVRDLIAVAEHEDCDSEDICLRAVMAYLDKAAKNKAG